MSITDIGESWANVVTPGDGIRFERGCQRGVLAYSRYFTAIGSFSVKTFADRHIFAAYHNKHRWRSSFPEFWSKLLEIDQDNVRRVARLTNISSDFLFLLLTVIDTRLC